MDMDHIMTWATDIAKGKQDQGMLCLTQSAGCKAGDSFPMKSEKLFYTSLFKLPIKENKQQQKHQAFTV